MGMTRAEIEAMAPEKASCYLAEKVMGWTFDPMVVSWIVPFQGSIRLRHSANWRPHVSVDNAMEAAEKVGLARAVDYGLTLHYDARDKEWMCWWYDFRDESGEPLGPGGIAPTPALAVCRAVIAAHEARNS